MKRGRETKRKREADRESEREEERERGPYGCRGGHIPLVPLILLILINQCLLPNTTPNNHTSWIIYLNILLTFVTVFALRGIYFALLQDAQFPQSKTGVIVGFVSLIGYTPDIFFGSLTGRILDNSPGVAGHQNYFLFLMVISILGLITTYFLSRNKTVKKK